MLIHASRCRWAGRWCLALLALAGVADAVRVCELCDDESTIDVTYPDPLRLNNSTDGGSKKVGAEAVPQAQ